MSGFNLVPARYVLLNYYLLEHKKLLTMNGLCYMNSDGEKAELPLIQYAHHLCFTFKVKIVQLFNRSLLLFLYKNLVDI
jgi:hypothetical protein